MKEMLKQVQHDRFTPTANQEGDREWTSFCHPELVSGSHTSWIRDAEISSA